MAFNSIALGTATMSASSVIRLLAQFFIVPILSRILSPADYGIMAMAMPFVIFTMMFTDAGVGQSLVRTAEQERGVWSTSFLLTIACGSAFALLIICLSPLVSMFFREPHLTYIVMALALVIIPQAGATIPEAALRRDHRFVLLALIEISSVFIGMSLAIFVAMKGGGAWALVAQQLGLYWSRFLLAFSLSSFRPTLQFDLPSIKEHLLFGKDILASKFVWYLTSAMDGPIIGKVLGSTILGYYSMAAMFSRLPVNVIVGPVQYVVFAHCAPLRDDKAALRQMMLTLTRMLAIVIFPGVGMIAAAHYAVFKLLLSEKWIHSGELFAYLAASTALSSVTGLRGVFMMIIGRADLQLRSAIEYFFLLLVVLLVFVWFGIEWLVIGYSLSVFLYFPRSLTLLLPHLECTLVDYIKVLIVPAVVTGVGVLLFEAINDIFPLGDWSQLFMGGFIGVVGIALSALVQFRPLKQELSLLRDKW